jgi:hypothetical protein
MTSLRGVLFAALVTCSVAVATATARADGPPANPSAAADQESRALLQKVLHQIVAGRTVSPLEDNALATWEGIRKRAQDLTPGTVRALQDFVSLSETRAATEREAGREMVAFDLQAFADMAQELLQRRTDPAPASQTAAVQPTPSVTPAPLTNVVPAPLIEPAAARVKDPISDTVTAVAVPKPSTPPPAPPMQDQTAALMTSRGDAMLAIKDVSAARKLYEQAADLGSAAAAKGLARTYDPRYVQNLGIVGMRPDVTMAAGWYDRAAALGDRESAQRMQELDAMVGTAPPVKTTP